MSERRLREALRAAPDAREAAAEERAWPVIAAARPAPGPRRGALRPASAIAVAAALAAIAVASLPAPRDAVADWVRAAVHVVAPEPARLRGQHLPGGGRLLAAGAGGPVVVGGGRPAKQLLGAVDEATWSAHGHFVAAVRGIELIAVDLDGRRRWSIARSAPIRHPRWDPHDGFRIAYLSAGTLYLVNGDGTGDRAVTSAGAAAPAWRPNGVHELAYADPRGHVVLRDVDRSRVRWRARETMRVVALAWSANGRRLLVVGRDRVRMLSGADGSVLRGARAPAGTVNLGAAFAPAGDRYALLRSDRAGRTRVILSNGSAGRSLLAVEGALRGLAWSPDGRWVAVGAPDADAWFLLHPRPGLRRTVMRQIGAVSRRYGGGAPPVLAGWAP